MAATAAFSPMMESVTSCGANQSAKPQPIICMPTMFCMVTSRFLGRMDERPSVSRDVANFQRPPERRAALSAIKPHAAAVRPATPVEPRRKYHQPPNQSRAVLAALASDSWPARAPRSSAAIAEPRMITSVAPFVAMPRVCSASHAGLARPATPTAAPTQE